MSDVARDFSTGLSNLKWGAAVPPVKTPPRQSALALAEWMDVATPTIDGYIASGETIVRLDAEIAELKAKIALAHNSDPQ